MSEILDRFRQIVNDPSFLTVSPDKNAPEYQGFISLMQEKLGPKMAIRLANDYLDLSQQEIGTVLFNNLFQVFRPVDGKPESIFNDPYQIENTVVTIAGLIGNTDKPMMQQLTEFTANDFLIPALKASSGARSGIYGNNFYPLPENYFSNQYFPEPWNSAVSTDKPIYGAVVSDKLLQALNQNFTSSPLFQLFSLQKKVVGKNYDEYWADFSQKAALLYS